MTGSGYIPSPATLELLDAIAAAGRPVTANEIRDEFGGWPAGNQRGAMLGVLVRGGFIERLPDGRYRATGKDVE